MNVLMLSPGYPAEMAFFTRGLGQAGATVIGLGDQHTDALPQIAREALDHYVRVGSLAAADQVAATVRELARQVRIDQVECLWEPYMVLAAQLREQLGLPGLTVAQTIPYRDKERMKQLLEPAGAAALGALLTGRIPLRDGDTVCVVASGGNVDLARLPDMLALAAPLA